MLTGITIIDFAGHQWQSVQVDNAHQERVHKVRN